MHADPRADSSRTNNVITTFDTYTIIFNLKIISTNLTKVLQWVLLFQA